MTTSGVETEYFPLRGGLDLLTPALSLPPGKCFDAYNYEPEISGGYRRINGFERFDGQTTPTSAAYWLLTINKTGTIAVGDTLTGATSGATTKVLSLTGSTVVGGRTSGTFVSGESITDAGPVIGTATSVSIQNGAASASDDADYALLAANDRRTDIQKVPGSGAILGVWVYNDIVYAFRNNAGGTAAAMYKSTAAGWSLVAFTEEISFSNANTSVGDGDTLTQGGVTATVQRVVVQTGTLASGTNTGRLIITGRAGGNFAGGAATSTGGGNLTLSGVQTTITMLPSGRFEFCNYNFTGSTATTRMYGCDGVNRAFEFDGTVFVPLTTGMTADTPAHIIGYKNYLFLSFLGSVQFSSLGTPYAWSVVLGAGEIATGDYVTGFLPAAGDTSGSSMAIFTKGKTYVLYGSSSTDFKLVMSNWDIGYSAYTSQIIGNGIFGLTARGVQQMITTLQYGDFDYASVTHLIQPFLTSRLGTETASTTIRSKNQYRVYFSDGTGIIVGLTGDKISGIMPLNYGKVVRCMVTTTLSTGLEVTYFGSDDGYVYQDNVGTSFDGSAIEAWLRLVFNHTKSPRIRKRYRSAVLELTVVAYSQVYISYDLGYGTINVAQTPAVLTALTGTGGYWDQFTWDAFTWDAQLVNDPTIPLDGTEKNIALLFYSNRAQDQSHTLQGVSLAFSPRRLER